MIDLITVAFFLTDQPLGICEVRRALDMDNRVALFFGNCRQASVSGRCDHAIHVARVSAETGGYAVAIDPPITGADIERLQEDSDYYREILLKHQVIEVL